MARKNGSPAAANRTVPRRKPNGASRTREHLTENEVNTLLQAAKGNRHGHRDYAMVLVCYRHGLRAQELCDLEWSQIDLDRATMHISRVKQGKPATHPIRGDVLRALRQLKREQSPASNFVFTSERGAPMKAVSFNMLVKRLGNGSKLLGLPLHAHMLRHACGYALINAGIDVRVVQDYLGHKSIASTVRYTELSANKFKDVWR
ncbi:MAG: tyrosine-type recombinase/integrase [Hyphomicrobiales bacterium]|nr:tyrosine-type recombinase/integrase [Hyphomicrobiales bacterium]